MKKDTLTEQQAARVIGVAAETLRMWRRKGTGPRWFRAGRLCRYRRNWLLEWIDANALANTSARCGKSGAKIAEPGKLAESLEVRT